MYRYAAPQKGRYREYWQLVRRGDRLRRPGDRRRVIQLYGSSRAARRPGHELELNSIGDRACRPAYLERARRLARRHATSSTTTRAQKRATSPLRVFDSKKPSASARRSPDAPTIGDSLCAACREHFAEVRRYLDAYGVAYELVPTLVRGLDYYTRTTFEFVGAGRGGAERRSPAAAATTAWSRRSAARRRPASASAPASSGSCSRSRTRPPPSRAGSTSSSPSMTRPTAPRVLAGLAELRARGPRSDTDYAGRSLKGQMTQAGRLGRAAIVVVEPATAQVHAPAARADVAVDARRARECSDEQWRDLMCGEVGPTTSGRADAGRLGRHAAATTAGSSSSTCATERALPARRQPGARARGRRGRARIRNEFVLRAEGEVVRRAPEKVNPNLPTGEVELQVDELEIVSR